jgi:hypothetical protein
MKNKERRFDTDIEKLSSILHDIYQEEAKRQAKELDKPVRHWDDYYKLEENIKEYDRVLARYILELVRTAQLEVLDRIEKEFNKTGWPWNNDLIKDLRQEIEGSFDKENHAQNLYLKNSGF